MITRRAFATGLAFLATPALAHTITPATVEVLIVRPALLRLLIANLRNVDWMPVGNPDVIALMPDLINQAINGGPGVVPRSNLGRLAYVGASAAMGDQTSAVTFFTQLMPQAWDYGMNSLGEAGVANQLIGYSIKETSKWEARALLICTLQAILDKGNAI